MMQPDLFGNGGPPPAAFLRPEPAPPQLDLVDAAAERAAMKSGRPKSQERAEILAPAGYSCLLGHPLRKERKTGALSCPECDR